MISIHVELSENEIVKALQAIEDDVAARSRAKVTNFEATLLWIPVVLVFAYLLVEFGGVPAMAMLVAVVVLVAGTNQFAARAKRRVGDYFALNLAARDVEFVFDDSHIDLKSAHSSGRTEWSILSHVVDADDFVLLFIDHSQAYVIPKRIPESNAIRELAVSKIESTPAA